MAYRAKQSGKSIEEEIEAQMVNSPLGRMGSPQKSSPMQPYSFYPQQLDTSPALC